MIKDNKVLLYVFIFCAAAAYIFFVFYLCRFTGLDADKANHILQAQDILQGNFWLKDWNMTGITFFTTDLLYYELAVLVTGSLRYGTAYIAYGLMVLSVVAVSLAAALFQTQKNRISRIILFACLFAIPCINYLGWLRIHSGAICCSVTAILIAASVLQDEHSEVLSRRNIIKYILVFVSLLLGVTGDMLTALEGTVPVLFYCMITILNSPEKYEIKQDKRTYLMLSALAAVAGAIVSDKLFFAIGGANKNSYIGYSQFSSAREWCDKIWVFFSNLLLMGDAGFMNERLNDLWIYTRIINGAVITLGVVLIFWQICKLIRGKSTDTISAMLSISFLIIACAYVFTSRNHFKYMTIEPAICYIIVLHEYDTIVSFMKNRRLWVGFIYALAAISLAGKVEAITHYDYPKEVTAYRKLAAFLDEHDLHYGYASFWNASVLSVISDNDVNVRHIEIEDQGRFRMYNWFNKNQWYLEDTNFILVDNTNDDRGAGDGSALSEDNIVAYFGTPKETYECSGYLILVYDHNLSKYLVGIEDGKIIPFEMYANDHVETEGEGLDRIFRLHKGGIVYGPYVNVVPGNYSLVFEGENLDQVRVDVYSRTESKKEDRAFHTADDINFQVRGERLPQYAHGLPEKSNISYQIVNRTSDAITVEFEVKRQYVEDVEFRMFCDEGDNVRLDQISIKKK